MNASTLARAGVRESRAAVQRWIDTVGPAPDQRAVRQWLREQVPDFGAVGVAVQVAHDDDVARIGDQLGEKAQLQHAPQCARDGRLPQVLGDGVAPRAVVLHGDVLDHAGAALAVVVGQHRVEAADRVEPVEDVDPARAQLLEGEAVVAAPAGLQLVLHLVQAERAAEGIERCGPQAGAFGAKARRRASTSRASVTRASSRSIRWARSMAGVNSARTSGKRS